MKNPFALIALISCTIVLFSCENNTKSNHAISSIKNIQYTELNFEVMEIAMDLETCSYNGYSGVDGDHLYFLDQFFCFLYEISPLGTILYRHLGLGNGPNEIPFRHHSGMTVVGNELLIMGNTYDAYLFKDYKNRERIQLKVSGDGRSLEDSRAYSSFSEIVRKKGNRYFYNIYSESAYCNSWEHSKSYFPNAHILMEVDLTNGEEKPIGKYSQYYVDNHDKINHLFQITYDIDDKDNFYVSYQADSLIYIYDKKFNPIKVFGFQGLNMDTHYERALPNLNDFNRVWAEDYPNKGYYTWLEYIDVTGMTFRSYQKGSHTEFDGLQIYHDGILIADVVVPKQFKVAGYIPPYYISQIICDEEAETMKFYKFMLD